MSMLFQNGNLSIMAIGRYSRAKKSNLAFLAHFLSCIYQTYLCASVGKLNYIGTGICGEKKCCS